MVFAALAAASALAYSTSLAGDFVFDDVKLVRDNGAIRSLENVPGMFARAFSPSAAGVEEEEFLSGYRPVRFASYSLDYSIGGLNPLVYHIFNVLFHIAVSFLVFLVARRIIASNLWAAAAAFLFAVHPIHAEAAAYISGRRDLLAALFFLLGLYFYMRMRETGKLHWAAAVIASFALAILSKEMAATLGAVCLIYELFFRSPESAEKGRTARIILCGLLIALALAFAAFEWFQRNPTRSGAEAAGYWGGSLFTALLSSSRALWHYIRLIIAPFGLSADYSTDAFPASENIIAPWTTLPAVAGVILLAVLGAYLAFKRKPAGFIILFFLTTLLPVMQIIPHHERVAERFVYLPSAAFFILAAYFAGRAVSDSLRQTMQYIVIIICLVFTGFTLERGTVWRNEYTFWKSASEAQPRSIRAQVGYAKAAKALFDRETIASAEALRRGDRTAAANFMSRAGALGAEVKAADNAALSALPYENLDPRSRGYYLLALAGLAEIEADTGDYESSIRDYRQFFKLTDQFGMSIAENPKFAALMIKPARMLAAAGRYNAAIDEYDRVISFASSRLDAPEFRDLYSECLLLKATVLLANGNTAEAALSIRAAADAARTGVKTMTYLNHLADLHIQAKNLENADSVIAETLAVEGRLSKKERGKPEFRAQSAKSRFMYGKIYSLRNDSAAAVREFKKAAEIAGFSADGVKYNHAAGELLNALKEHDKAAKMFRTALEITDVLEKRGSAVETFSDARKKLHLNLAISYMGMGENSYSDASIQIERALYYDKDYVEAHSLKGILLLVQKKYADAAESFNEALRRNPRHQESVSGLSLCKEALNIQNPRPGQTPPDEKAAPTVANAALMLKAAKTNLASGNGNQAFEDLKKTLEFLEKIEPSKESLMISAECKLLFGTMLNNANIDVDMFSMAVQDVDRILILNPTATEKSTALLFKARALGMTGDVDNSISSYKESLNALYTSSTCRELAVFAFDKKKPAVSETYFRRLLKSDRTESEEADAHYYLGALAYGIEDFESASEHWKKFLELEKFSTQRAEYVKKIFADDKRLGGE